MLFIFCLLEFQPNITPKLQRKIISLGRLGPNCNHLQAILVNDRYLPTSKRINQTCFE